MKKVETVMFRCGYMVGRLFVYYPKVLKKELYREKNLLRKKV